MGENAGLLEGKYGYNPNKHYLELTDEEEAMLEQAERSFENVIVVINSSNAMELGKLDSDENVDAIIWVGGGGQAGFNAVGQILVGEVNPSGKLVDTYASDFTKDPSFVNFSDPSFYTVDGPSANMYTNVDTSNAFGYYAFVQYEEGIYTGYRYYETAHIEAMAGNYKDFNYDEAVVYPFGYGLSYTTFDWKVENVELNVDTTGIITVGIEVTNTGTVAGKDVVELYYSALYTLGGDRKISGCSWWLCKVRCVETRRV